MTKGTGSAAAGALLVAALLAIVETANACVQGCYVFKANADALYQAPFPTPEWYWTADNVGYDGLVWVMAPSDGQPRELVENVTCSRWTTAAGAEQCVEALPPTPRSVDVNPNNMKNEATDQPVYKCKLK